MREMKNKNPSFHIEKEGFLRTSYAPVYKRSPSFYLSSYKACRKWHSIQKMNLLPRFQRASPSTSLDTMSKRINFINFCVSFDNSKSYTLDDEVSTEWNIV